ncbi:adenosylcobinamide-GDP ribazoletransferase [Luteibacter aegosomatissinici]|uniref:adenosylcobinamide-GDP ribazoletransferase n=1 Tax=Luteibacter aegosomatissinici TaxID=2911539 RepID=UPI001FF97B13|nr:adenosylcobinamide-GDP ribazoletransferase [Luteibacter aegosomatissinici]UPG94142.1 adenosylcobinamide-GDP ribazoletransferase [Luteibacter aegosomatissinici]
MRAVIIAFGFLTRLPLPKVAWDVRAQAASLKWYPLVGFVLGLIVVAAAWCFQHVPSLPAAALLLVLWVIVTGALHLDGLADSADAWIGGMGDRERTLAIMKDPRCGPAGVMSLILVSLIKFAALTALVGAGSPAIDTANTLPWALLLPPLLARGALVALFLTTPYVRDNGLGAPLRGAPALGCQVAVILTIFSTFAFGYAGAKAFIAALLVGIFWRRACMKRINGFTGDTAGAMVELIEAATLIALLV